MSSKETKPYKVISEKDEFRVVNQREHTVLTCQGKSSAENYVDLLNKAYVNGYKAGYRKGREIGKNGN